MKRQSCAQAACAVIIATSSFAAHASLLLFDRGLPSINLNNTAGALRSNVTWQVVGGDGFTGDNFTIGTVGQRYRIDSISVWGAQYNPLEDDIRNIWLYFGKAGDALSMISTGMVTGNANSNPNIVHSFVPYADGITYQYQGSGGGFYEIAQTTFRGLDLLIEGGVTYNFGVDGDRWEWWNHASNAALSGTTQQGADGKYLVFKSSDFSSVEVVDSKGDGWDKSSDINVQVTGVQIPEPTALALAGIALLGLCAVRRRHSRP